MAAKSGILHSLYDRWFKLINYIPKRIRIVAMTAVMTSVMIGVTFFPFYQSWYAVIPVLLVTAYLTTYIAIFEGIDRVEWYMLFIMPLIFVVSMYLFYLLFPARWLTRLPLIGIFSLVYYAILLTSNIFNIGVEKSIQLYRAAFSVNYFIQTFVIFLAIMVMLTLQYHFLLQSTIAAILVILLSLQMYWAVNPKDVFDRELAIYAFMTGLFLFEASVILSFMPLKANVSALIITAAYYSLTGIVHHTLGNRLYTSIVREYSFVFAFVCVVAILTLQW